MDKLNQESKDALNWLIDKELVEINRALRKAKECPEDVLELIQHSQNWKKIQENIKNL